VVAGAGGDLVGGTARWVLLRREEGGDMG
jgi:hypothetical protein